MGEGPLSTQFGLYFVIYMAAFHVILFVLGEWRLRKMPQKELTALSYDESVDHLTERRENMRRYFQYALMLANIPAAYFGLLIGLHQGVVAVCTTINMVLALSWVALVQIRKTFK